MKDIRVLDSSTQTLSESLRTGAYRIDPELADRFLAVAAFGRQRKVAAATVKSYAELMHRGLWLTHSQIAFCRVGGRLFLVNGQHRLRAIIESGQALLFSVVVYECEAESEVAAIYTRFDTATRPRSTEQILSAVGMADANGLSKVVAKALYNAMSVIENGMSCVRPPKQLVSLKLEMANCFVPQAKMYENCLARADRATAKGLLTAGATAVALTTLAHSKDRAVLFWSGVADNDGLSRSDPRATLRTLYLTRGLQKDNGTVMAPMVAWNAFYRGNDLRVIKFNADTPIRILGTPVGTRKA